MSARRLGLVVGRRRAALAGVARRIQRPLDFPVVKAGLPGGRGQWAEVGRVVGVQGAVGGPEQACVAVPFLLPGNPARQPLDAATD